MNILVLLILLSVALAGCALAGFIWAVRTGQFEDPQTPAFRILTEDCPITAHPDTESKQPNTNRS